MGACAGYERRRSTDAQTKSPPRAHARASLIATDRVRGTTQLGSAPQHELAAAAHFPGTEHITRSMPCPMITGGVPAGATGLVRGFRPASRSGGLHLPGQRAASPQSRTPGLHLPRLAVVGSANTSPSRRSFVDGDSILSERKECQAEPNRHVLCLMTACRILTAACAAR